MQTCNSINQRLKSFVAFLLSVIAYAVGAGTNLFNQSLAPHYVYLADAFLKRQLHIDTPVIFLDLILFQERLYVPSPPMPSVLMMPFVFAKGTTLSDISFCVILGALNVSLVQKIFNQRWLTLFFALGTPHLYFSILGSVWFQAQLTAIFLCLLALWAARSRRAPMLTGILWGGAILSRFPTLLGVMFPLVYLLESQIYLSKYSLKKGFIYAIPISISVGIISFYNRLRFGSWLDFGYLNMLGAPNIVSAIESFGNLSVRYLPCNFRVAFLALPVFGGRIPQGLIWTCSHLISSEEIIALPSLVIQPNPFGMSLFLVSPLFLLLPLGFRIERSCLVTWLSLIGVMLPNWMAHNTGSLQFGYRYWLDAAPMWLVLLSKIYTRSKKREDTSLIGVFQVLVLISIVVNLWGAAWMYQNFVGVSWVDLLRSVRMVLLE